MARRIESNVQPFPAGGGQMGALIRAHDWSKTPLGPIEGWSDILKGAVSLMLPAQAQIVLFWGAEFVALYNDAYAPTIGQKHPGALGRPARESWSELWDDLEPLLQRARAGETVVAKDRPFQIDRKGFLETVWFDISYSPACNAADGVEGVVCIVAETTERVRAQTALRESEARWRELADNISQFAWTADATGRRNWYNKRWYDYTGTTFEEMQGWGWRKVHHPDHVERVVAGIKRCFETGEPWEDIFPLRGRDGRYRTFLSRALPIRDAQGRVVRWFGTNTDISAQAEAEERLRQSETQFRTLAQAMPDHVWTALANGDLDWVNDRVIEYAGTPAAALVGQGWLTLVHPDDLPSARNRWAAALAAGTTYETEFRLRRRDGAWRWHIARAVPVRDPALGITRWIGTNTDIDDQKTAALALVNLNATALEHSEARLRAVFETSYQYQGLLTLDGILLKANPTSLAGIKAQRADVVGRPFWDTPWFTGTPGMPEMVKAAIPRVAAGEVIRQEIVVDLPTGRRAFDFSMRPVINTSGEVIAIVPEAMEVTERRAAEEQLRQSQKMEALGQLTGGIAHDFNNMLTGIMGAVDIIRRRIKSNRTDDLDRYIEGAITSTQRAAALTHRLLAFARRQSLEFRAQDIDALVAGLEEMLRRTIGEKVALKIVPQPELWYAMTDANQLESAIVNLAINARDAMVDGGRLTIETANVHIEKAYALANEIDPGDYVSISVTDTGAGMPPEVIERAFDPFFTTKPVGQGTGLGLSMIYGFIKQSGGHVQIHSKPGAGTTVTLYLRRASESAEQEGTRPEAAMPRGRGETVLVVEDNAAVRLLIVEVLDELGYRYFEAADARAALRHLDAGEEIDLLVTDVGLPNINGRQLAEMARQKRPELKVLFITGYAEHAAARADLLPGRTEIVAKPFSLDVLAGKIRELIEG